MAAISLFLLVFAVDHADSLPKYILIRDCYALTDTQDSLLKSPHLYHVRKENGTWNFGANGRLDSLIEFTLDECEVVNECYMMLLSDAVWSPGRKCFKQEAVIKIKIPNENFYRQVLYTLNKWGDTYKAFF